MNDGLYTQGEFNDLGTLLFSSREFVIESLLAMENKLETTYTIGSLSVFVVVFMALISLSYGVALPSGLFMPAILTGCAFGGLVGRGVFYLLQQHFGDDAVQHIQPGLYALVGGVCVCE